MSSSTGPQQQPALTKSATIYHEKQTRQLCGLHVLNNLFQHAAFNKADLDSIAKMLAPNSIFNPHMSPFGLGNYDINVIQVALQNKNYEAIWFNKSKDPSILNLDEIYGFILNIPNTGNIWRDIATLFTASKRHWVAIKQIGANYYNLDSKKEPSIIGNDSKLIEYLRKHLSESNTEIFIIATKEAAKESSWLLASPQ